MTSIYWGSTRNCSITVGEKNNDITIRRGAKLTDVKIDLGGSYNSLIIGHDVVMTGGQIVIDGQNTHVRIGHRCSLDAVTIVAGGGEPVLIGDDCSFGVGSQICNLAADSRRPAKPIFVPSRTQVGAGAQIFKGTLIGEGATIPENALVAGTIPGKHLTNWTPTRILNAQREEEGNRLTG